MKNACEMCGSSLAGRHHHTKYCFPCAYRREREPKRVSAYTLVHKSIKTGELKLLDGSVMCADCGKPASDYDHRDYFLPLTVSAVCRSCNHKRGSAMNSSYSNRAIKA